MQQNSAAVLEKAPDFAYDLGAGCCVLRIHRLSGKEGLGFRVYVCMSFESPGPFRTQGCGWVNGASNTQDRMHFHDHAKRGP